MKKAFDIAQELLKSAQSQFDSLEVICSDNNMAEMQIDAGEVSLLRKTHDVSVTLRAIKSKKYATVDLNQTDKGAFAQGLDQLRQAIDSASPDEARVLIQKGEGPSAESRGPAEPDFDKMYQRIEDFNRGVKDQFPEINLEQAILQFHRKESARVNSSGYESQSSQGFYMLTSMFSAKRGTKASSFNHSECFRQNLNDDLIRWGATKRVLQSSVNEIEHQPLSGKFQGHVLVAPEAMDSFLWGFLSHLSDDRMIPGTSVLRDKMNQEVANSLLTVRVNPDRAGLAYKEFSTKEGYKSLPGLIVENGILRSWLLSDYGARKTALTRATTGGANIEVDSGQSDFQEIVRPIKKGILLGRFSGGMPAANGDISGIAKNSYLIENGEVTKPLSEVMISANLFEMFKNIEAVSSERLDDGMTLKPYLRVGGVTIAGK